MRREQRGTERENLPLMILDSWAGRDEIASSSSDFALKCLVLQVLTSFAPFGMFVFETTQCYLLETLSTPRLTITAITSGRSGATAAPEAENCKDYHPSQNHAPYFLDNQVWAP